MKPITTVVTVTLVLSLILVVQAFTTEKEAAAWGLPEGFNPQTGKIEKTSNVITTNDLLGTVAKNERGEDLGTVEDILFSKGRIAYVVLSRKDQSAEGERLVPIPWKASKAQVASGRFVFHIDKDKFDNAPSFARNDWQRINDPNWNRKVNSYY